MPKIQRGSTPTIKFTVPNDTPQIISGTITLSQNKSPVIKKSLSQWSHVGNVVSVRLTQEDTLKLNVNYSVEIQLKPKFADGTVPDTKIHVITADRVLDEEVL